MTTPFNTQDHAKKYDTGISVRLELEEILPCFQYYLENRDASSLEIKTSEHWPIFGFKTSFSTALIKQKAWIKRFVGTDAKNSPAEYLYAVCDSIDFNSFRQMLFYFTAKAEPILLDFMTEIYWPKCVRGHSGLTPDDVTNFVGDCVSDGRTKTQWSPSTINACAGGIIHALVEFGFLHRKHNGVYEFKLCDLRLMPDFLLAFLFFHKRCGFGFNSIAGHDVWRLFNMGISYKLIEAGGDSEVFEQLSRISLATDAYTFQYAHGLSVLDFKIRDIDELKAVLNRDTELA